MNAFQLEDETQPPVLRIDPELGKRQVDELSRLREARDSQNARDALRRLEDAAGSPANLMPAVLSAAESGATLGEISDTLRGVFGVYEEQVVC